MNIVKNSANLRRLKVYNVKTCENFERNNINILNQNSHYLNRNPRQVDIAPLERKYRKSAEDIFECWVDLPPEVTRISQFVEPIILRLV